MKNWYKSGQNEIEYTTVLFVPITKGGTLAKEVRQREYELNKNCKIRIKIIESEGGPTKTFLSAKGTLPKIKM